MGFEYKSNCITDSHLIRICSTKNKKERNFRVNIQSA